MNLSINKNSYLQQKDTQNTFSSVAIKDTEIKNDKIANISKLSDNRNYFIPFLGRNLYTPDEKEFLKLRKAISRKFHEINKNYGDAYWDYLRNMIDHNRDVYYQKLVEEKKYLNNKEIINKLELFKNKDIKDPVLKRHLNDLIETFNQEDINFELLENKINQLVNNHGGSQSELGDLIAPELINLVKERNVFAKERGFSDYFSYVQMSEHKIDEDQLFKFIEDFQTKSKDLLEQVEQKQRELPGRMDNYIISKHELLPLSEKMYKGMGWDLSKKPIEYDLFPKNNKDNISGLCLVTDPPNKARILANLTNDLTGLETLLHEEGHAVYHTEISDHIPYLDKNAVSGTMDEAVAMLMQSLPFREKGFFKKTLDLPGSIGDQFILDRKKDLIERLRELSLVIKFEREMYQNPDQDLVKLWQDLKKKYYGRRSNSDNEWATIPHYVSHPGNVQNYLRAIVMGEQIYQTARKELGNLTENQKTADFFRKKLFRHGSTITEDEAMIKLTGSTLKPDAFFDQFKNL